MSCLVFASLLAGCGGSKTATSGGGGTTTPTVVTFNFTGSAPTAVATQIGDGAYTQATLSSGTLTLSIPHGETNFSVSYLCPPFQAQALAPMQNLEFIVQASIQDGTSFSRNCLKPNTSKTGTATVQVNAAAISGATYVVAGDASAPWSTNTLDLSTQLDVGTQNIPVYVQKGQTPIDNYLAIKILRNQTVPGALNDGSPVVFSASDKVTPQTITYNSTPAGYSISSPVVIYETASGPPITLDLFGPTGQYLAVPSAAYQSGDYYLFSVSAGSIAGNGADGAGTLVGVEDFTATAGPQTFTFPAPWTYSSPTASPLPTFSFAYSGFSGMSTVSDFANVTWSQGNTSLNEITITATVNYQNGSTSMTVPDLSSLSGFLSQKSSSGTVSWTAEVTQGYPTGTNPPLGTIQYVANTGTYTLP